MANNKVSSLLNKQLPRPPRSNFNLGRVNRFTADVGYVIPCYVEEVLPNSYKRLDVEGLINTNATVAPFMGSFTVKLEAFFVPLRLYHRHLSLNDIRPDFHADFRLHFASLPYRPGMASFGARIPGPQLTSGSQVTSFLVSNYQIAPGSLFDYLGMGPVGYNAISHRNPRYVNGEPFIGYFDIWRNYYANPHDRRVPFVVQNGAPSDRTINNDLDGVLQSTQYRYFNLGDLDNFILNVNTKSVETDEEGVRPNYVDVVYEFSRAVIDDWIDDLNSGQIYRQSVPFFAGQGHLITTAPGEFYPQTSPDFRDFNANNGIHFGLLPRTYKDDYFNSRFMNEFVQYLEETATVTVENNSFNISQLRIANRIAKYIDKSIFSDTRFGSWIKAHFGVKTNSKLDIPQFLGSMTSTLLFNDIYATAQTAQDGTITDNTALGSRSSLGQSYLKNKGAFVEFQATEPGYIMCMFSLIPNVSYFQGIRKMYLKTSFNDLYRPEFDAIGYQPLTRVEMDAVGQYVPVNAYYKESQTGSGIDPAFAPLINYPGEFYANDFFNEVVGQHPAWLEYMCAYDESHGLMTQRYQYGYWTNNRPFNPAAYELLDADPGEVVGDRIYRYQPYNLGDDFDRSTYIRSEYFNTIFAVDKYTDNFQVQLRFYDKTKQPMSKQVLPSL